MKPGKTDENQAEVSGEISVREAGARGGRSTRDRYAGTGFYQRIGAIGGKRQNDRSLNLRALTFSYFPLFLLY